MECRVAYGGAWPHKQVALVAALMVVLGITGAFGATAATAHSSRHHVKPTVRIAKTAVGPLLVNKSGYTVYMFVRDKRRKDVCIKIKHCERDWPAVTTKGKPIAGPGVKKSLLGSIPYKGPHKGHVRELTYRGHPLHTYRFDTSKRSVINIGNRQYHGAWYALNAKGHVVK